MISAVIFDYGGVLSTSPFAGLELWDRKLGLAEGTLREGLFGDYHAGTGDGLVPRLERGEVTITEFAAELQRFVDDGRGRGRGPRPAEEAGVGAPAGRPEGPIDIGQILGSNEFGVHWMVVARARRLRDEGYRVGLLTNNIREYGEAWKSTIPMEIFDDVVDSSVVGLRKPDPRIFRMAAERLGTPPEECVFLDDVESNVQGARGVGMAAIVVGDPWAAIDDLDRLLRGEG